MLSAREKFKVAFLQSCAERGLTEEETHAEIRSAIADIEKAAAGPAGAPTSPLSQILARYLSFPITVGEKMLSPIVKVPEKAIDVGGNITENAVNTGGAFGLLGLAALPAGIGFAGGNLLAGAHGLNDEDMGEQKTRELIDEYSRNAMLARFATEARQRRALGRR